MAPAIRNSIPYTANFIAAEITRRFVSAVSTNSSSHTARAIGSLIIAVLHQSLAHTNMMF